jgi:hypothetical protein
MIAARTPKTRKINQPSGSLLFRCLLIAVSRLQYWRSEKHPKLSLRGRRFAMHNKLVKGAHQREDLFDKLASRLVVILVKGDEIEVGRADDVQTVLNPMFYGAKLDSVFRMRDHSVVRMFLGARIAHGGGLVSDHRASLP